MVPASIYETKPVQISVSSPEMEKELAEFQAKIERRFLNSTIKQYTMLRTRARSNIRDKKGIQPKSL
jgi:hypothetical protein